MDCQLSRLLRDPAADHPREASVARVRRNLPVLPSPSHPRRGLRDCICTAPLTRWAGTLWAAGSAETVPGQLCRGALAATWAGMLVILGHDAAHGSLTPWHPLNAWWARRPFLPARQPASGWQEAQRRQDAHTKPKHPDDGYPPLPPAGWQRLPAWRDGRMAALAPPRRHIAARAFPQGGVATVCAGDDWSSLVGLWRVGALTLQQHLHPRKRWFDDAAQRSRLCRTALESLQRSAAGAGRASASPAQARQPSTDSAANTP